MNGVGTESRQGHTVPVCLLSVGCSRTGGRDRRQNGMGKREL